MVCSQIWSSLLPKLWHKNRSGFGTWQDGGIIHLRTLELQAIFTINSWTFVNDPTREIPAKIFLKSTNKSLRSNYRRGKSHGCRFSSEAAWINKIEVTGLVSGVTSEACDLGIDPSSTQHFCKFSYMYRSSRCLRLDRGGLRESGLRAEVDAVPKLGCVCLGPTKVARCVFFFFIFKKN